MEKGDASPRGEESYLYLDLLCNMADRSTGRNEIDRLVLPITYVFAYPCNSISADLRNVNMTGPFPRFALATV